MERLTEFHGGIWGLSPKAVENGYDRYSVYSKLAEYENTDLTPDEVETLKYLRNRYEDETYDYCGEYGTENCLFKEVVDGHLDKKIGWIPVSERLPEVAVGTEDEDCPEFNVTIKGAKESTTLSYSWDGTWFDNSGNIYEVLAWMPLPEPYKAE